MATHRWDPRAPLPRSLVVPTRVGGEGGPSRGAAAGAAWRRTSWGHCVPSEVARDEVLQRVVEIGPRLGDVHQLTGWAALRLRGAQFFDGHDRAMSVLPVDVVVGRKGNVRQREGVRLHFTPHDPGGSEIAGVRVVSVERAIVDLMRSCRDARAAVIELDKVYAAELTSRSEIEAWLVDAPRLHHLPVVRRALVVGRENVRSPRETEARLTAELEAGLPRLLVNATVLDARGVAIGEVDLLDEEAGLVIEVDGAEHRNATRQARDVIKDDRLRDFGLEVIRLTGNQTSGQQAVERILAARRRARFAPVHERVWSARAKAEDLAERRARAVAEAAYFAWVDGLSAGERPPP